MAERWSLVSDGVLGGAAVRCNGGCCGVSWGASAGLKSRRLPSKGTDRGRRQATVVVGKNEL